MVGYFLNPLRGGLTATVTAALLNSQEHWRWTYLGILQGGDELEIVKWQYTVVRVSGVHESRCIP